MILAKRTMGAIGLDVGSRWVKAVQIERARSSRRIVAAASLPRTRPGTAMDEGEAARVMKALWRQGFSGMRVVLAVPPEKLLSGVMELPARASGVPLDEIARQELARSNRCEAGQIEMAWWELPGGARAAEGTHVMAVGCRHGDANALMDQFEAAGAEVVALDVQSPALARACGPLLGTAQTLGAVVELGWNATQVLVLRGSVVVYERSMKEHGLGPLQASIQAKLGVEADVVRAVVEKIGCGSASAPEYEDWEPADRARSLVSGHAEGIAEEVKLSLAYAERRFGSAPERVLVTGGGSLVPGMTERLRAGTGARTDRVNAAELHPAAPEVEKLCGEAPLAVALGLAMHEFEEERP